MKLEANMRNFLVSIQKEDKFFVARCPELSVTSQGNTLEEAQANIKEAIELYIESFGSHVSLEKVTYEKTYRTVVPMHPELAKGTLLDILQQTGMNRDELFRLLK